MASTGLAFQPPMSMAAPVSSGGGLDFLGGLGGFGGFGGMGGGSSGGPAFYTPPKEVS